MATTIIRIESTEQLDGLRKTSAQTRPAGEERVELYSVRGHPGPEGNGAPILPSFRHWADSTSIVHANPFGHYGHDNMIVTLSQEPASLVAAQAVNNGA